MIHETRELALLIDRLGSSDPDVADDAGTSLMRAGHGAIPALLESLATIGPAARRRVVFLLGRIQAPPEIAASVRATLEAALADEDWKVRRNAAVSLGEIADLTLGSALLDRVDREPDARVRSSLMLAIGKTAGVAALPRLRALTPTTPAEAGAHRKSLHSIEGRAGRLSSIRSTEALPADAPVELWTRHGIADIATDEARAAGLDARVVTGDRVAIRAAGSLDAVLSIRSALYPVLTYEEDGSTSAPEALGRAFDASMAAQIMRALTDAPVTYRLTVALTDPQFRLRRDWIAAFSSACSLENRATAYAWEVIVRRSMDTIVLGARPAAVTDRRFSYRVSDIPASLHPTLATAAVLLAPASPDDVIVDPFCGAGTLLAERARLGPYRSLLGIDVKAQALDAARKNLAAVEHVALHHGDFADFATRGPVDVILTNPPYGRRVGNPSQMRALHRRLDELAAHALKPGGWLVVFRPIEASPPSTLDIVSNRRVDVGGFEVNLIAARRPR